MLRKLVASALFAGVAAGLIAVALQFAFVQPLLLEAERYESGEVEHFARVSEGAHDHGTPADEAEAAHNHSTHEHPAAEAGGIDFVRDGLSVLFSVFVYVGYALMLVAGFAFAEMRGKPITARIGLLWGLGGFAAIQLAPAFGLPIEMPGSAAADVTIRQVWWLGTVACTATALWLIGYGKGAAQFALAVLLLLLPHLIGAPHPDEFFGPTPPELASHYASRALATSLASWAFLGLIAGHFWEKEATA